METIFINSDNLNTDDLQEEVTRVKALVINSNDEILLGYSNGTYQFLGGHMEDNESFDAAINREVKEESGIELGICNVVPFLLRKSYIKNYLNSGKNRCNKIYYFAVRTDENVNLNNTNYTDDELKGNFCVKKVALKDVKRTIVDNNIYSKYKDIAYEMLDALNVYFKKSEKDVDKCIME